MCVNSKRSCGSAGLFRVEMVERGAERGGRHTAVVAEEQLPPSPPRRRLFQSHQPVRGAFITVAPRRVRGKGRFDLR
jgi:hypothetical protein